MVQSRSSRQGIILKFDDLLPTTEAGVCNSALPLPLVLNDVGVAVEQIQIALFGNCVDDLHLIPPAQALHANP